MTGTLSLRARFSYFYGPYDYQGDVPMVTEKFNVSIFCSQKVSGYDQEIPQSELQTNPLHREEEPQSINKTTQRQLKYK